MYGVTQQQSCVYSGERRITKTACTLLPYSILNLIKVDITYLRTVILTASTVGACWLGLAIAIRGYATGLRNSFYTAKPAGGRY